VNGVVTGRHNVRIVSTALPFRETAILERMSVARQHNE